MFFLFVPVFLNERRGVWRDVTGDRGGWGIWPRLCQFLVFCFFAFFNLYFGALCCLLLLTYDLWKHRSIQVLPLAFRNFLFEVYCVLLYHFRFFFCLIYYTSLRKYSKFEHERYLRYMICLYGKKQAKANVLLEARTTKKKKKNLNHIHVMVRFFSCIYTCIYLFIYDLST
jgi:hypothetical protein